MVIVSGEHARMDKTAHRRTRHLLHHTQQEDNATYNALARAAAAGKVDLKRLAVLRTASNFDRPYPGQSACLAYGVYQRRIRRLRSGNGKSISCRWLAGQRHRRQPVAAMAVGRPQTLTVLSDDRFAAAAAERCRTRISFTSAAA